MMINTQMHIKILNDATAMQRQQVSFFSSRFIPSVLRCIAFLVVFLVERFTFFFRFVLLSCRPVVIAIVSHSVRSCMIALMHARPLIERNQRILIQSFLSPWPPPPLHQRFTRPSRTKTISLALLADNGHYCESVVRVVRATH